MTDYIRAIIVIDYTANDPHLTVTEQAEVDLKQISEGSLCPMDLMASGLAVHSSLTVFPLKDYHGEQPNLSGD